MPRTDTASAGAALPRWHDSAYDQADTWPSMPGPLVQPARPGQRPTSQQRANDAAFVGHQQRLTRRAEAAADLVVALVVAIALAVLLLHWLVPCEAGHLCMAALAVRRVRAGESAHDTSPPSALPLVSQALRDARESGYTAGERTGYVEGWRWGAICGFLIGILSGGCLLAGALMMGVQS